VDRIDKVTKADIRRVANDTFQDTNRTVGVIETVAGAGPGGEQGSEHAPSEQAPSDQAPSDQAPSDQRASDPGGAQ